MIRRLFADVINDVGQLLDMLSALVPSNCYLLILSISAICKGKDVEICQFLNDFVLLFLVAFCGVAAGATKLCITNHLARLE